MYQETTGPITESPTAEVPTSPEPQPSLSPEQLDELRSSLSRWQAKLDEDNNLTNEVENVLREYLHRPITSTTIQSLGLALEIYVGFENAQCLVNLLRFNDADSLKAMQNLATPPLWQWLRRLLAIYGQDLQEAYKVWNENPDGWRDASRRAAYDFIGQKWWINLKVKKYDGTTIALEDSPQSLLQLASWMVDTLSFLSSDQLQTAVLPAAMAEFSTNADRLAEIYAAEPEAEEPAVAEAAAQNGAGPIPAN